MEFTFVSRWGRKGHLQEHRQALDLETGITQDVFQMIDDSFAICTIVDDSLIAEALHHDRLQAWKEL